MPAQGRRTRGLPRGLGLTRARQRQLLSQADLAKKAGVAERTVRYIEAGDVDPKPSTKRRLLWALELDYNQARRVFGS